MKTIRSVCKKCIIDLQGQTEDIPEDCVCAHVHAYACTHTCPCGCGRCTYRQGVNSLNSDPLIFTSDKLDQRKCYKQGTYTSCSVLRAGLRNQELLLCSSSSMATTLNCNKEQSQEWKSDLCDLKPMHFSLYLETLELEREFQVLGGLCGRCFRSWILLVGVRQMGEWQRIQIPEPGFRRSQVWVLFEQQLFSYSLGVQTYVHAHTRNTPTNTASYQKLTEDG